jgi:hypothetical protein
MIDTIGSTGVTVTVSYSDDDDATKSGTINGPASIEFGPEMGESPYEVTVDINIARPATTDADVSISGATRWTDYGGSGLETLKRKTISDDGTVSWHAGHL